MKITLITTILFFSLFNVYSQQVATYEEVEEINDIYYYKSTTELFTGILQDTANITGDYMRIHLVNGIADGFFEGFYDEERTVLKWRVLFVDGAKEGEYIYYFEDGSIGFIANMKANKLHGVRYCYYETGELWHIHHYRKDKEHGKTITYNKSGQLTEIVRYKKGLKHGKYEKFYENGSLKQKGRFRKDKPKGRFREYDEYR
jgi:Uncharacterized protein conserved in bacteria